MTERRPDDIEQLAQTELRVSAYARYALQLEAQLAELRAQLERQAKRIAHFERVYAKTETKRIRRDDLGRKK